MARKTLMVLIAAILVVPMVTAEANAQSATDLGNLDCGRVMKELRAKTPPDVAADLKVPLAGVYNCMRAAKAARAKRIGEPSARTTGVGTREVATPSPTPIM